MTIEYLIIVILCVSIGASVVSTYFYFRCIYKLIVSLYDQIELIKDFLSIKRVYHD